MSKRSSYILPVILVCVIVLSIVFLERGGKKHYGPSSFCTILPSKVYYKRKRDTIPPFVGSPKNLWDDSSIIHIFFYDGLPPLHARVLALAETWARLGNLTFKLVYLPEEADVRISFCNCAGYSSLVGKQAWDPGYAGRATMCLFGLDTLKDKLLFTQTVLHEFGHAMGMLHELQNPAAHIPWDTAELYRFYKKKYGWGEDSVNEFVLKQFTDSLHSRFDSFSIMLYSVPREVIKGNFQIEWPTKLSSLDSEFIMQNYH